VQSLFTSTMEMDPDITYSYAMSNDAGQLFDATAMRTPLSWMNDARPSKTPNVQFVCGSKNVPYAVAEFDIFHAEELLTDYGADYFGKPHVHTVAIQQVPAAAEQRKAAFGRIYRVPSEWAPEAPGLPSWPLPVYPGGRYTCRRAPPIQRVAVKRRRLD
jgi:hypothetical protein